jgi:hypothetical protein
VNIPGTCTAVGTHARAHTHTQSHRQPKKRRRNNFSCLGTGFVPELVTEGATAYGLDDQMIGVRFLAGIGNFSLRHRVQTASQCHPAPYPMNTGGSFPGGKAAGA